MPLETAQYIHQLEPANPPATDLISQADDHIRMVKAVLQATFPNVEGPVTLTHGQLNASYNQIPVGLISAWYGSAASVPAGWAICDGGTYARSDGSGNIVTPNLVDRAIIGAGTTAPQGQQVGSATSSANTGSSGSHSHTISGGAHSHAGSALGHALVESEIPAHRHLIAAVAGQTDTSIDNQASAVATRTLGGDSDYRLTKSTNDASVGLSSPVGSGTAHSHSLQIESATHTHTASAEGSHQHTVTVSTIQPSLGLHYIMKI